MRRTPLKRGTKVMKRTKLRMRGKSETSVLKDRIQFLLREIVMLRDKKCILHGLRCYHAVGLSEGIVWQAEHLIERSNSATYADTRLVVLVCKNCHGWKHFKKSNHDQYDKWVKSKLSRERVQLWERCEAETWKVAKVDWKLCIVDLERQLNELKNENKE